MPGELGTKSVLPVCAPHSSSRNARPFLLQRTRMTVLLVCRVCRPAYFLPSSLGVARALRLAVVSASPRAPHSVASSHGTPGFQKEKYTSGRSLLV